MNNSKLQKGVVFYNVNFPGLGFHSDRETLDDAMDFVKHHRKNHPKAKVVITKVEVIEVID